MNPPNEKPPKPPIPAWGWVFAGMCILLPILTLGGAIPGGLGAGGAAGCVAIARDPTKSMGLRIGICIAIVVACWGIFGALALLLARARS